MTDKIKITVTTQVNAPVSRVWEYWTLPRHIVHWNAASDDWHTPHATNDLNPGGRFLFRMEARDGTVGFDLSGTYNEVETEKYIAYTLDDERQVRIQFENNGAETGITEIFEAETTHTPELQQAGWQAILNNFKKYTESS